MAFGSDDEVGCPVLAEQPVHAGEAPEADLAELRRAERIVVRLRWLAMGAWPLILLHRVPPVAPSLMWGVYALAVLYVGVTHGLNHSGRAIRATALGTVIADAVVTALGCSVTRGLDSPLYPFFYLTTLATSLRFGMAETLATVILNAALSAVLLAAPGSAANASDLALRAFYLFFVALEGGLLSREARGHSRRRQQLLRRLIHAEEEERRRLAGEIHDRVGRRFFEFHHALDRGRTEVAHRDAVTAATLERLADDARACADEIRTVTNELRPTVLDDFGFIEALREYAATLQAQGDLAVTLRVEAPRSPAPAVGVMLYRVLQEAILNVRKHAAARRVDIELAADDGALRLCVRDDGRGFDAAVPPRGHFGLLYMRERVEGCGGRVEVRSHPGAGSEVRVTVPLGTNDT
jgi:two-component system, NarL family, sensor kinase